MHTEVSTENPPPCSQPPISSPSLAPIRPATDEGAQDPLSHHGLNLGDGGRIQPARGMKGHCLLFVRVGGGFEYPIDDAAVKMHVLVQRRAEAVNEGHRLNAGLCAASGTVFPQAAFHHAQENAQDGPLQGRVWLQEVAQPLWRRQHPLPHRQERENMIGQMHRVLQDGHTPLPLQE